MITTFYPPYHFGGDGTYVRVLTHAWARRRHEVTVIHDRNAYDLLAHGRSPEQTKHPDRVVVHGLRSRYGALACFATHQTGRPIFHGSQIAEILSEGFDVIHFHNISLIGGPGILAYGHGLKLYTAHEHWLVCPTHTLWRHNREPCTERQCIRCLVSYRRPPQIWRVGPLLARNCRQIDTFITSSQSCADRHREFGFDFPMQIMPPFLPDEEQVSPVEQPEKGRPYFLFVGRLESIKGLQDVIAAFDGVSPFELRIVGADSYESELRELAAGKGSIRLLGYQEAGSLGALYRNAIAVVMPSLYYEVLPMVILEAFREGAPIIARNRGPFPELVKKNGGGLLFDTISELRQVLGRLASDDQLRESVSCAAARVFREKWTGSIGLRRYFQIIEQATRKRGGHTVAE